MVYCIIHTWASTGKMAVMFATKEYVDSHDGDEHAALEAMLLDLQNDADVLTPAIVEFAGLPNPAPFSKDAIRQSEEDPAVAVLDVAGMREAQRERLIEARAALYPTLTREQVESTVADDYDAARAAS